MKGVFHARLRAALHKAVVLDRVCSVDDLAVAMQKTPRSLRQYLKLDNDAAGALDLDEAEIALHRIGSSLAKFLTHQPPKPLSETDRIANRLEGKPALIPVVKVLLGLPRSRLTSAVRLIGDLEHASTGRHG